MNMGLEYVGRNDLYRQTYITKDATVTDLLAGLHQRVGVHGTQARFEHVQDLSREKLDVSHWSMVSVYFF